MSFSVCSFFPHGKDTGKKSEMGLLGRLPTVCFYSRSLLSGHLNVHSVLEGRQLLILVDRVDTDGERAPLPWVDTNTAARLRLQSGFVLITGTWEWRPSSSRYLGRLLALSEPAPQPTGRASRSSRWRRIGPPRHAPGLQHLGTRPETDRLRHFLTL